MSEAAYLIWVMRCERVIPSENVQNDSDESYEERRHSMDEVHNRFVSIMNKRLEQDRICTQKKFGRKALKRDLVLGTWEGALLPNSARQKDWLAETGVLVGIKKKDIYYSHHMVCRSPTTNSGTSITLLNASRS